MAGSTQKGGKRKLSAFNIFMKSEIKKVKAASKNLTHMQAFKQAAQNWKKNKPAQSGTQKVKKVRKFSHPKKGQASRTRKGKLDFVTHKGNKCFNKSNKRQCKKRKPYQKK